MQEMRLGRHANIEALQAHISDVYGCSGLVAQRRAKRELGELDQGFSRLPGRYFHTLDFAGWPDAQTASLCPHSPLTAETIPNGKMKGVQFYMRVKVG